MTQRLYVIMYDSGTRWLARGSSAAAVLRRVRKEAASGESEWPQGVRRPNDRGEINALREWGNADPDADPRAQAVAR